MLKKLTETDLYILAVDESKNRLYQTARGKWIVPTISYRYKEEMKNALNLLKRGFTVLNDGHQAKTVMSPEWAEIATEIRKWLVDAGIKASAEVLPENVIAQMQINRVSRQAGFQTQYFSDVQEAENWLDSLK
ncbi:hypothetical protein U14_05991 [Candidatus Moduliflexus flocculans]|uniref:STAS/SEC14 domain-containing protein n=1 Tax=Candidatus Moduliflexus flocculans TaxID=1499966 RepID=A0A081BTH2_9BACT|nr:hypothetical protein U14_05991 [Candidatus Moduliflexus flocculans]